MSLEGKKKSTLLREHEAVNTLPWWVWIEQSDAHMIQATVQTKWQLLGKASTISARDRGRERDGGSKGGELSAAAVMLSETLPRCCVPPLCISHCWRPSLSGQSGVSSETSASPLECPRGNSSPRQGAMDGRTVWSSAVVPPPLLEAKAIIEMWMVTCPPSKKRPQHMHEMLDEASETYCGQ